MGRENYYLKLSSETYKVAVKGFTKATSDSNSLSANQYLKLIFGLLNDALPTCESKCSILRDEEDYRTCISLDEIMKFTKKLLIENNVNDDNKKFFTRFIGTFL